MGWYGIDQALMKKISGLTPAGCDRLTLPEIEFILSDGRCPDGHQSLTDFEMDAEWAWWQSLSAEERMELGER